MRILDDDVVGAYLREIGGTRLLSRDEERQLLRRIAEGDREAFRMLVTAHLKLVVSVCREFAGRGLPLSDLISEGNLGLMRAARGFDAARGRGFAGYAAWRIRRRVTQALTEQIRAAPVPQADAEPPAAAQTPVGAAGWGPEAGGREGSLRNRLDGILTGLPTLEREVICLHFGLGEVQPMTLEEIGALLGLGREKVRQIKERALERLRKPGLAQPADTV